MHSISLQSEFETVERNTCNYRRMTTSFLAANGVSLHTAFHNQPSPFCPHIPEIQIRKDAQSQDIRLDFITRIALRMDVCFNKLFLSFVLFFAVKISSCVTKSLNFELDHSS